MIDVLGIIFWLGISFMAVDYPLRRANVRDPLCAVIAAVFAVLFVVFVRNAF